MQLLPISLAALAGVSACTHAAQPKPTPPATVNAQPIHALTEEAHLADLRQLTFGGENAEAYWSWSGTQLIFQARPGDGNGSQAGDVAGHASCDRIYRMELGANPTDLSLALKPPAPIAVSDGRGATTCSYFLPGDGDVIYASTEGGGAECPPRPDHSHGYVWALYDSFDIYRAHADGSGRTQLTNTKGYDAEGTVCAKDGSIVFTSTRDGDIDLYRMDADGKNVKRLTNTAGYDGGAFFSPDCSKIVWRASRPKVGAELADYKKLLSQGLVRPTKLEIYVANADGSEPVQLTYLNAASFGPYWFPSGKRVIFASNYGDPRGREFDLWAVNTDGTQLERITYAGGFDGFPMFSPDGKYLAFSSNRATPAGSHDTNMFVARWVDAPIVAPQSAADRIQTDIAWLADPAREGRGLGGPGLDASREYLVRRMASIGLQPAGDGPPGIAAGPREFGQRFAVTTRVDVGAATAFTVDKKEFPYASPTTALTPLGFSASGDVRAPLVFAGYGMVDHGAGRDDYRGVDARKKIVVLRRFAPEATGLPTALATDHATLAARAGDLRQKVWTAREHGAAAVVIVDWPDQTPGQTELPKEAALPELTPEGYGDAGIPVLVVTRATLAAVMHKLTMHQRIDNGRVVVALTPHQTDAWNLVGRISAAAPNADHLHPLVLGAHYDHLGLGGRYSLAPDSHAPHLGADDNASGTATLLEVARNLYAARDQLARDVLVIAFSAEESGVLGSTYFTRTQPKGEAPVAMLNFDMVGRMRRNELSVLGTESAAEWRALVEPACAAARVDCRLSGDGYGPSDQMPFYAAGTPVLFFFTGAHSDYHKPSDTVDRINAAGAAQVAQIASVVGADPRLGKLTYKVAASPLVEGDRRSFHAGLGTIPDYAGPPNGQKGVLLAGVRKDGAAEKAGLLRGDIVVQLGSHAIGSVEDLMYALQASMPGDTVEVVLLRNGQRLTRHATFEQSHAR